MSTDGLKSSAFYDAQIEAGATDSEWEGWWWAGDFGEAVAEHVATRTACDMWEHSRCASGICAVPMH